MYIYNRVGSVASFRGFIFFSLNNYFFGENNPILNQSKFFRLNQSKFF